MSKNYFFIAVSNKYNLDLCRKHCVAGFPNSINGLWAFYDIDVGDYISFLYAAKAYDLYEVIDKIAIDDPEAIPKWKPLRMRSGRKYTFPFRLILRRVRKFQESLIRSEFNYIAENLLLRGGYAKTHFQADQTTLQNVSQMGEYSEKKCNIDYNRYKTFTPKLTLSIDESISPYIFPLKEVIIQALIRRKLSDILKKLLEKLNIDTNTENWEILGEKALPEGHVDIFIKQRVPIGLARCIIVEVKRESVTYEDLKRVLKYKEELRNECIGSCIVAKNFSNKILKRMKGKGIIPIKYDIKIDEDKKYTFQELLDKFTLSFI